MTNKKKNDNDDAIIAELSQNSQSNTEFTELLQCMHREKAKKSLADDKDIKIKRLLAIVGMQEALIKRFYKRNDVYHACDYYNINGIAHNTRVELAKRQDDLFWCLLNIVRGNLLKDPDFNHKIFLNGSLYQEYLEAYNAFSSYLLNHAGDVMGRYNFEHTQEEQDKRQGGENVG